MLALPKQSSDPYGAVQLHLYRHNYRQRTLHIFMSPQLLHFDYKLLLLHVLAVYDGCLLSDLLRSGDASSGWDWCGTNRLSVYNEMNLLVMRYFLQS